MMRPVVSMVAPRSAVVSSISLLVLFTVGRISSHPLLAMITALNSFSQGFSPSHPATHSIAATIRLPSVPIPYSMTWISSVVSPRFLSHHLSSLFSPSICYLSFSPCHSSHLSLHMTSYVPPLLPILLSIHILPYLTPVG